MGAIPEWLRKEWDEVGRHGDLTLGEVNYLPVRALGGCLLTRIGGWSWSMGRWGGAVQSNELDRRGRPLKPRRNVGAFWKVKAVEQFFYEELLWVKREQERVNGILTAVLASADYLAISPELGKVRGGMDAWLEWKRGICRRKSWMW